MHSHEQKNSVHLTYQITWQWHKNYDFKHLKTSKTILENMNQSYILIFSVILFLWVLVYFINLYWGWFSYWVYNMNSIVQSLPSLCSTTGLMVSHILGQVRSLKLRASCHANDQIDTGVHFGQEQCERSSVT